MRGADPILAAESSGCSCPSNVFAFEATPTTPAQQNASFFAPKRWQALRNAATAGQAVDGSGCSSPELIVSGRCGVSLTQSSVFMMMGTDESAPHTCPQNQGEGPCFLQWQHHVGSLISEPVFFQNAIMASTWQLDSIMHIQCMLGWPAHFGCPNGYQWIPPSAFPENTCSPLGGLLATCLSCLPGTYSQGTSTTLGGPYRCLACQPGTFASSPGSSQCVECPANSYASQQGATICTLCSPGNYTVVPGAYSSLQCVGCPPGIFFLCMLSFFL